jgi:deoxyribodipyrimidine photo-lyase
MQTEPGMFMDSAFPAFPTGYNSILEKIQNIQPLQYAKTRNFINGAVTYLSPYISRGVISVQQVQEAVLSKGYPPRQIEKFLQELAWREYYQRVWQVKGAEIEQDLKQPQPDTLHHQMVTVIEKGETGITVIDAQIKNLAVTGYLHNHIRMYIASITCNIAKAHWYEPARWMYYHLLDGDLASNHCSWQWVAGAFSSKKYYCNQENINTYTHTNQRHSFLDTSYEAIPKLPVPASLKATHPLSLRTELPETALPVIDTSLPTLLYNSYNLDPVWRKEEQVNRVLLLEPSHFSRYPVSNPVIDFILRLSKNIPGIQVYGGEVDDLISLYKSSSLNIADAFIAKEHPAFRHYPGRKDSRDWLYPKVTGYYPSFFGYWKKCGKYLF